MSKLLQSQVLYGQGPSHFAGEKRKKNFLKLLTQKMDDPQLQKMAIAIIKIYHLVMTNSSTWKDPPFIIGKPSISMGHLYHGYVK